MKIARIAVVAFADEAAKFVAENQQEVDFSAERPDGAFCAHGKLYQQIAANQGRNLQQSELFSVGLELQNILFWPIVK